MSGYVYILANRKNGAIYIGVTRDLVQRMNQHKRDPQGFVQRYQTTKLVWSEPHGSIECAIQRETSLKRWKRVWKIALIEEANGDWRDLSSDLTD